MKNKVYLILLPMIVLGVLAFWYLRPQTPAPQGNKKPAVADKDLMSVVENPDAAPREKYEALIRLGQNGSGALEFCQSYLEQKKDILLRQGAANCLGYMKDDLATSVLEKVLTDSQSDSLLKRTVLEALGRQASPARAEAIQNYLQNQSLPEAEKAAGYISLVRISKGEETNEEAVDYLIKSLDKESVAFQRNVLMQLINLLPHHPKVQSILRHEVYANEDEEVVASGLRHLAAVKDEWVTTQLDRFAKHPSAKVRRALVSSLHLLCPEKTWELLYQMATAEKDPMVVDAILLEPLQMKGKEAQSFYKKLLTSPAFSDASKQEKIKGIEKQVTERPLVNSCKRV